MEKRNKLTKRSNKSWKICTCEYCPLSAESLLRARVSFTETRLEMSAWFVCGRPKLIIDYRLWLARGDKTEDYYGTDI